MKEYYHIPKKKYRPLSLNLLGVLLVAACSPSVKNNTLDTPTKYLPLVTVLTDTCPPPETIDLKNLQLGENISIIKTGGGSFELRTTDGKLVTDIIPPTEHKAAALIADFTNFKVFRKVSGRLEKGGVETLPGH